jgi:hypothetical protein
MPRFEYLRALSLAKTATTDTMIMALNALVLNYPNHAVTPLAKEIIQKYGKTAPATTDTTKNAPAASVAGQPFSNDTTVPDIYTLNFKQSHFYIMIVDSRNINVSATKIRITDFISKDFKNLNLTVNAIVLDGGWQMLTVSSFRSSEPAMDFYRAISQSEYIMSQLDSADFKQMVISMDNYPVFYREKKYEGYLNFFRKNYFNEGK